MLLESECSTQEIADATGVEEKRFSQKAVSREKISCLNTWHARLSDRASRQERKHAGNFTKGKRAKTAPTTLPPGFFLGRLVTAEKQKSKRADNRDTKELELPAVIQFV